MHNTDVEESMLQRIEESPGMPMQRIAAPEHMVGQNSVWRILKCQLL